MAMWGGRTKPRSASQKICCISIDARTDRIKEIRNSETENGLKMPRGMCAHHAESSFLLIQFSLLLPFLLSIGLIGSCTTFSQWFSFDAMCIHFAKQFFVHRTAKTGELDDAQCARNGRVLISCNLCACTKVQKCIFTQNEEIKKQEKNGREKLWSYLETKSMASKTSIIEGMSSCSRCAVCAAVAAAQQLIAHHFVQIVIITLPRSFAAFVSTLPHQKINARRSKLNS